MAQSLTDVLSQIRGGSALYEAGQALQECVQATRDTGKPSKLTFSVTIEPDKTDETVVTLQPDITVKLPKKPKAKGIFFMDKNGRLTREDPRQIELELERKAGLEKAGAIAFEQSQQNLDKVGRGN